MNFFNSKSWFISSCFCADPCVDCDSHLITSQNKCIINRPFVRHLFRLQVSETTRAISPSFVDTALQGLVGKGLNTCVQSAGLDYRRKSMVGRS